MSTGGSIESVTLAGRIFAVAADAESQRKLGGFENELEMNGDGTARLIKTRMNWMLDGLALSVDDSLGDLEYLQNLADKNTVFTCLITYASGVSYAGEGQIIGEVQASSQKTTVPIALHGAGKLTKQ